MEAACSGWSVSSLAWLKPGPLTDDIWNREAAALCLLHCQIEPPSCTGRGINQAAWTATLTRSGLAQHQHSCRTTAWNKTSTCTRTVSVSDMAYSPSLAFCVKPTTTISAIPGIYSEMVVLLFLLLTACYSACVLEHVCVCVCAWLQAKE